MKTFAAKPEMVLVSYSDSEGSDSESTPAPASKAATIPSTSNTNFAVDKSNPKKIRVNLNERLPQPAEAQTDGEPPAKRPRVGDGAFSGFNAMLPAPKRDNIASKSANGNKTNARKVFSLKTGAEPAFSRDSDAELRNLFAEDGDKGVDEAGTIPSVIPKPAGSEPVESVGTGKVFMFKPLSVSRNSKMKKSASQVASATLLPPQASENGDIQPQSSLQPLEGTSSVPTPQQAKKINLFSSGPSATAQLDDEPEYTHNDEEDEIVEVLDDDTTPLEQPFAQPTSNQPESLNDIASTLNLSAAERRQLLGRHGGDANKIISFNTDKEYAANQAHIAAGEQIQHNPVRSIGSGKHSLKQLISSAQGQKDALEESFAAGRRNKKEAGSKYGW